MRYAGYVLSVLLGGIGGWIFTLGLAAAISGLTPSNLPATSTRVVCACPSPCVCCGACPGSDMLSKAKVAGDYPCCKPETAKATSPRPGAKGIDRAAAGVTK